MTEKDEDERNEERWANMTINETNEKNNLLFGELHAIASRIKKTFVPIKGRDKKPKTLA